MSEEKKPLLIVDGTDRAQEDFQEEADRVADSMKRFNANAQKVAQYDSGAGEDVDLDYYTVADALDYIGVGKFHFKLLVVVSLISVAGGLGSSSFALFPPLARCHLGLGSVQEAFLTSAPLVGAALGGVCLGYVTTRWGRRMELIIMMMWTSFFGFLSSAAPTYWWLIFLRVLVGFGHGGTGQRLSILFEYMPTKYRTIGAGVLTFCWNFGNFLESVLIKFLIPTGIAWRLILIVNATVFAIGLLFYRWLPESAFYLMGRGRRNEARRLLVEAARQNGNFLLPGVLVTEEEKQQRRDQAMAENKVEKSPRTGREHRRKPSPLPLLPKKGGFLMDLFRPFDRCLTTVLLSVAWFAVAIAVVGCTILTEELLQMKQSLGSECRSTIEFVHDNVCEELDTAAYTPILIVFASEFPALFLTYYSASILGRRKALALSFFLSGLFFGLLIICPVSTAVITAFLAGAKISVTTSFSLLSIYTPEVYPTSVRGIAVGAFSALYRLGGASVPFVSQVLLRKSVVGSKSVHAAVTVMTAVVCLLLPIETNHRQLGE